MGQKVGSVEFYAGPKQLGAPDDLEDVIIKFIKGAKKKLCIAVQELENENIANAIIEARLKRKVSVEMVIEQSYLRIPKTNSDIDPWQPLKGNNEANRTIHDALLRANIDVKTDYNEYIFHQKFIIRDGKDVLTGSTNFTDTGTSKNLNHIVIVRNKPA
ncbi:MAG: phospholipase D-like domain-containing protein, partial [Gammaproteobacteria bacterium]|nr:phospholipase D-like domain-containing protein [Gammaproteobacteria bacterium]